MQRLRLCRAFPSTACQCLEIKSFNKTIPLEHSLGVRKEPQTLHSPYRSTQPPAPAVKLQQCCHPLQTGSWASPHSVLLGIFVLARFIFFKPPHFPILCMELCSHQSRYFQGSFGIAAPRGKCLKDPGEGAGDNSISEEAIHSLQLQANLRQ